MYCDPKDENKGIISPAVSFMPLHRRFNGCKSLSLLGTVPVPFWKSAKEASEVSQMCLSHKDCTLSVISFSFNPPPFFPSVSRRSLLKPTDISSGLVASSHSYLRVILLPQSSPQSSPQSPSATCAEPLVRQLLASRRSSIPNRVDRSAGLNTGVISESSRSQVTGESEPGRRGGRGISYPASKSEESAIINCS